MKFKWNLQPEFERYKKNQRSYKQEKCKRAHDHVVYMEEYRTAKEYLKNITTDGDCIIIEGKKRN